MLGKSLAILVVSPRERSGTTLTARLFAEFFRLSGDAPLLFDTDVQGRKLAKYFPQAEAVDLAQTRDQMRLFDTLPLRGHVPKIVDVSYRAFSAVFDLLRDINLVAEARANDVEPVIIYIPHNEAADFERGYRIREHFGCEFVVVENDFLGKPPQSLQGVNAYWAMKAHPVRIKLPLLDQMNMNLMEDERVSLTEFMKVSAPGATLPIAPDRTALPLAYLSLDARSKIRNWVKPSLREVQRAIQFVQARLESPVSEPQSF